MNHATYQIRRRQLEEYFDRTAAEAWTRLTSDAPVGRIRATVRAGRNRMRETLLGYLPGDLSGLRVLDAGCGTGALAVEAAARGAEVVAIDLSSSLVDVARARAAGRDVAPGRIEFQVADMLDPDLGEFDWVVAMDSLIHYAADDLVAMVERLADRSRLGVAFTFAPRTRVLSMMHRVGQVFPRANRSPDIVPIEALALRRRLDGLSRWRVGRSERIDSTFYTSQTMELVGG
ncbi:MAG: magnesium protoporphyrin IX methyltransferase [Myxococcota bacterium]